MKTIAAYAILTGATALFLAGCTQEQQNKISRDIQNWTGTNGVLEIYAGDKLVRRFMLELQGHGVSFALDDFGAGYTSFRYLRDFCFDMIKIDGQFIRKIAEEPDNQILAAALQAIAHHFDMFTVAESVETADDAAFLIDMGIDCLQGYYFGAPTIVPPWRSPNTAAKRN